MSPLALLLRIPGWSRNGQFALVKRIVAERRGAYLPPSMLNDRSSILSLLETRRSGKPRELVGPGPATEELERILTIASRVPDWQASVMAFVSVSGGQRDDLAVLFRQALAKEDGARPQRHEKADEFAHYASQRSC
jgi:hypothetical protein